MKIKSWGCYPEIESDSVLFDSIDELRAGINPDGNYIVHALGRSYGDSALSENVILTKRFNNILAFDEATGTIVCESGVTLAELLDVFLPRGFFPSITPGTKFITIGGAIASDVHGKNHHAAGCFSECVVSFELMLADGSIITCSRDKNIDLFYATIGGMGLTGIITYITFQLARVTSSNIRETVIRCRNLEEVVNLFHQHKDVTYSVAWIDSLAKGNDIGRSVLMLGEHADDGILSPPPMMSKISVPVDLPGFCLNRYYINLFNRLFYLSKPKYKENRLTSTDPFFYPLDVIAYWNRIYGSGGFTQYQFVLPLKSSMEGMKNILAKTAQEGKAAFLSVLKLFGKGNEGYLSFPMEGLTLILDFKIQKGLFEFLHKLDEIVIDYGGRIYLAKDVRMGKEVFRKGYPRWEKFAEVREKYGLKKKFNSLQSKRLGV